MVSIKGILRGKRKVDVKGKSSRTRKVDIAAISGKKFVLTGTMWTRRSLIEYRIRRAGGTVQAGVKRTTDFLVTGRRPGSVKVQDFNKVKARTNINIKTLTSRELRKMLEDADSK